MSVDQELQAIGNVLIGRINYDFKKNYNVFTAFRAIFKKSREDIKKLNKLIR